MHDSRQIPSNAPLSCWLRRHAADLRSLPLLLLPSRAAAGLPPRRPWALKAPGHVIGPLLHLRAAAELETAGHTWRAHGSAVLYLSGTCLSLIQPITRHLCQVPCGWCW
ncbi:hypothetical protein BDW02DRAFT_216480 [Decorospora gaudefroyi]|uniref:Uncharacterized protein n=1 Tax=Decorospora gaudefroyi TaxID=184978 RepID=A0A6A5KKD9_9PLEO|nr:hypothetical protein BDW02DRAFT_216480 [Decorospora gaudefroyi]